MRGRPPDGITSKEVRVTMDEFRTLFDMTPVEMEEWATENTSESVVGVSGIGCEYYKGQPPEPHIILYVPE